MRTVTAPLKLITALALGLAVVSGCESTDGGGSVSGSVYYGVDSYDPWYYGHSYDDVDIVVTPPSRPEPPPRPTHPIAPAPTPRPTPMPSIPRAPMPRARAR